MNQLLPLSAHPTDLNWPTRDWPHAPFSLPSENSSRIRFDELMAAAFDQNPNNVLGLTQAVLIVQSGRIIVERYATDCTHENTFKSWSMAKSITQALVGIAVGDGLIDIYAPAPVREWSDPADPRHGITWDQLLRMSSGLDWVEEYAPDKPSDVIEMLYSGNQSDYGHYAANKSLAHAAGSMFYYSSGTTNIIARALQSVLGLKGEAMRDWMFRRLFTPIGMTSPQPKFDPSGTFVGSSFCFCSARDFARFGYLYLRDGVWNGERILPEGWVDYARTPTPVPETEPLGYGAHWWLGLGGLGSFSANGFQGQYTIVVPDLDMVIVRHGISDGDDRKLAVQAWLGKIADCFRI